MHATLLVTLGLVAINSGESRLQPPGLDVGFASARMAQSVDDLAAASQFDAVSVAIPASRLVDTVPTVAVDLSAVADSPQAPSLQLVYTARSASTGATAPSGELRPASAQGAHGGARPAGPAGGPSGIATGQGGSFFGLQAYGDRIVFVVDISGSMHGKRFRRMRRELRRSIQSLTESQQFFVIFFNHQALPMPAADLLAATPGNILQMEQWLKEVETGGGTNPLPGLLMALELRPDSIYLLTDGKFDPQTIWAVAQAEPPQPIPINTISFASKSAERLLTAIAEQTGGTYLFVK